MTPAATATAAMMPFARRRRRHDRDVWPPQPPLLLLLLLVLLACEAKNVCYKKCKCLGSYVDCSRKSYHDFPEALPQWTEDLDLSANKIQGTLNVDIGSSLKITTLKLNKNFLTSFPSFVNKTRIDHLNLAHNKINKLDDFALENLPNLKVLDMNRNKLEFLGSNVFRQSSLLRTLLLSNNLISNLSSDCFDTLIHLVELKISHNRLYNLPNGLFKNLRNLELLDISRNYITVIEGLLFKDLGNLRIMILRHNSIRDLQDGSFYGLSSLKQLHLEGNSISKISKGWLYGLNSLINLNISYNKIDQIISGWEYAGHLEHLDLSYNNLQFIEKSNVENLRKLQRLYLNNNRLSFIEEGSFNNTPLLRVLHVDNNHLAWMIEDTKEPFVGLMNLVKLSLVNNNILYIKKESFYGLENLSELNLLENNILEIEEESFNSMPNLMFLYLNTSSLVCDCSLAWIKEPLTFEQLPFDLINVVCGFPEKNRGKSLDELSKKDFICSEKSPKPVVVFHPESKMVLEKQNITLKCGVNSSSTKEMNFVWKKDNHNLELISTNYYSTFEVNGLTQYSFLNLYNISMEQSGKYQCVASNEFGITYSNRSMLSVVVFPFFAKVPSNSSVKTGQTAILECAAVGFPPPQISWQKDGGNDFPAAQERRMKVMTKDDSFLIIDVKLVDMGVYSCTAKNVVGMIASNATLTVLEPPWFGSIMVNKEVKVGEEVVLECLCNGYPKPEIKWKKDGNLLTLSKRHFFTASDQLLVIVETSTDDSGTYQCEITNSVGTNLQEVEVVILPFYWSLIHEHTLGVIVVAVIVCIIIAIAFWVVFIRTAKRPSSALINNVDNKSLNSSNSKDSGTGESTKRSQELLFDECVNPCQQLNQTTVVLSPEITSPLIADGTVILGENSVFYQNSTVESLPVQLPTEKPCEQHTKD